MMGVSRVKLKLDPRTKLFLTFIVSALLIGGNFDEKTIVVRIFFILLPAVLIFIEGNYKKAFLYTIFVLAATFADTYLLGITTGTINILVLIFSSVISRFFPALMMGSYTMTTTTVSEFLSSMERLKLSKTITIPFSVMFRFIPTILDESKSINNAMKMRGITTKEIFKNPILYLEYKLVPLIISVVKIGEELSAASLTKGLGYNNKRTNICTIGFHTMDILLVALSVFGVIYLFIN